MPSRAAGTADGGQPLYSNGQEGVEAGAEQGPEGSNLAHLHAQQQQQQQPAGLSFLSADGLQVLATLLILKGQRHCCKCNHFWA